MAGLPLEDRGTAARFGVIIYDGVEPIDIGGTIGVPSMARRVLSNLKAAVIAEKSGPVRLAGQLTIMPEFDIA